MTHPLIEFLVDPSGQELTKKLAECWPKEMPVEPVRWLRPPRVVWLGAVLGAAAAMALAACASPTLKLGAGPDTCGRAGTLTGTSTLVCTYSTVGSDTFTVPAGVSSVNVDVVGAQGGHYFITGDAAHGGSPAGDQSPSPGADLPRTALQRKAPTRVPLAQRVPLARRQPQAALADSPRDRPPRRRPVG
jgi:hypothetical protein